MNTLNTYISTRLSLDSNPLFEYGGNFFTEVFSGLVDTSGVLSHGRNVRLSRISDLNTRDIISYYHWWI